MPDLAHHLYLDAARVGQRHVYMAVRVACAQSLAQGGLGLVHAQSGKFDGSYAFDDQIAVAVDGAFYGCLAGSPYIYRDLVAGSHRVAGRRRDVGRWLERKVLGAEDVAAEDDAPVVVQRVRVGFYVVPYVMVIGIGCQILVPGGAPYFLVPAGGRIDVHAVFDLVVILFFLLLLLLDFALLLLGLTADTLQLGGGHAVLYQAGHDFLLGGALFCFLNDVLHHLVVSH